MTSTAAVSRLSPRHRECLAGVLDLKSSKEIAHELGLGKGTVDNYLTEATRLLGARDRRAAARMLADLAPPAPPPDALPTPDKVHVHSAGVGAEPVLPAASPSPEQRVRRLRLPFRQGVAGNDLTYLERLLWIPGIALAVAIGFGMLAVGLTTLGDFAVRVLGIAR